MFEAVYIADSKTNLVYEYLVLPYSPNFKSLISTIRSKQQNDDFDQEAPAPLIEINDEYFVCSRTTKNLMVYLLCLVLKYKSFNPLIPFVLIDRLLEVMEEYFGTPLASTKIDASNDTLTLLINEMIDDGIPNVTDVNKLRDLVQFKSLLSKILSTSNELATAAGNKSLASLSTNTALRRQPLTETDDIPWRRANVRYTNNEMFVDVIETVNVILKPKKNRKKELSSSQNFDSAFYSTSTFSSAQKLVPVTGTVSGQIDLLTHLSGIPTLQILLNSAATYIEAPQFHPCIKLDSWLKSRTLTFVPPDGRSTLMTYQVDLDTLPEKTQLGMLGLLEFDCQQGLGVHQNEFEIRAKVLKHVAVSKIESLLVEVFAFEQNDDDDDEDGNSNQVSNIKAIRVTHGDFRYKGNGKGEWTVKNLATGVQPVFRGSLAWAGGNGELSESPASSFHESLIEMESKTAKGPISPLLYSVSFSYKGCVPSGLKVDSLKVVNSKGMGDSVKPYKGAKYVTNTGDYTIRL